MDGRVPPLSGRRLVVVHPPRRSRSQWGSSDASVFEPLTGLTTTGPAIRWTFCWNVGPIGSQGDVIEASRLKRECNNSPRIAVSPDVSASSQSPKHEEFMALFVRHETAIHSFLTSLLANLDDAEVVMQETGMAMWKKFDQFETGTSFRNWAFQIARFEAMNFRRKQPFLYPFRNHRMGRNPIVRGFHRQQVGIPNRMY